MTHQALRHHRPQDRPQQISLDAEIEQARHCGCRRFGVQRGQHEMSGERGVHGDMRGLAIAHLADHDDVGVLTNE